MIAEKLTTIAENTPKVYDKGYEDGKNSAVDCLQYAQTVQYIRRDLIDRKEITVNLNIATTLQNLFRFDGFSEVANKNVEHITVNCPNAVTSVGSVFHAASPNDTVLKRITFNVDTSKATAVTNMFRGCVALETIDGTPLDFSSITGTSINFQNLCTSLIDIRFAPNTIKLSIDVRSCPNLSAESIQSVIDGLADLTGGTAQTLTLHKDVGAKLADEQKATITAKNWTLVY